MLLEARNALTGQPQRLEIQDGVIRSVTPLANRDGLPWVAPSFFDPQINGCLGLGFVSEKLCLDHIRTITQECVRHGIGGYCPTLITASYESILHGFRTLTEAIHADRELDRRMPGFHLEGPYLSSEDGPRGAHPRAHCRDPQWEEFQRWQDAAEGRIRMVTVAPERTGAIAFIEQLTKTGVVVAIGHTAANRQQIQDAVQAGAKTSTHLGNGSHAMIPRHDNYIFEQLGCDSLWASLITDGHHLPPALVKIFVRVKGVERLLITCDAGNLAGMPPGKYQEWDTLLEVLPSGKIVVSGTPFLAGSGDFTDACVARMITMSGVSLADAIKMASIHPRELLGYSVPQIEVGGRADLVVFDWDGTELKVKQVVN